MGVDDSLPASVYHTLYFPPDPPSYYTIGGGNGVFDYFTLLVSFCSVLS